VRLLDLHDSIRLTLHLEDFFYDMEFAPLTVNQVLCFILVELLLPDITCVHARRCAAPRDIIGSTDADGRHSGKLGTAEDPTVGELEVVKHPVGRQTILKVRVTCEERHAGRCVVTMNNKIVACSRLTKLWNVIALRSISLLDVVFEIRRHLLLFAFRVLRRLGRFDMVKGVTIALDERFVRVQTILLQVVILDNWNHIIHVV